MTDTPGRNALRQYIEGVEDRSQHWLAKLLRIGQSSVSLWMRGHSRPSLAHVIALQHLAGIPMDAWLTDEERQFIASIAVESHKFRAARETAVGASA
jgi:transcriptional regulator with XRE-family HTH domain